MNDDLRDVFSLMCDVRVEVDHRLGRDTEFLCGDLYSMTTSIMWDVHREVQMTLEGP
jgi:hypothetical protein